MTTIDHPARSSGRSGRGFKSRHPDKKPEVKALRHDLMIHFAARTAEKYSSGHSAPPQEDLPSRR